MSARETMPRPNSQGGDGDGPSLAGVMLDVLRHPYQRLVRGWNWKSALLSSVVRGAIFFGVNLAAGWSAAGAAFLTEFVFRATTATRSACPPTAP